MDSMFLAGYDPKLAVNSKTALRCDSGIGAFERDRVFVKPMTLACLKSTEQIKEIRCLPDSISSGLIPRRLRRKVGV
jgi:hypothetical protein